ncbi:DEAD/DEAH box helicase [Rhodococcus sp. 1168]|uniref:DEAD/DEAH box helicase n=1 Tax=Rhodococcus sp. 1168 TaxID=2018041 RepID=UPI000A09EC23|nr:DEAD/DEAH box helicase [Rhodococcus sp. 1168]ORI20631.1 DEAD/DEAH box helicase [Rhodococcus sp. 1168]
MPRSETSFADLGLRPVLIHALNRIGIDIPFDIQTAAIPDALAGQDILGRAPTGSGKTFAFGLPMLQRLSGASSRPRSPRGLILVPTRELALQIERALEEPALALGVRVMGIVGGVPMKRQSERLMRGVDVVVATPGRLEDLIQHAAVSLADIAITVVDEADRMADLGFLPQVRKLVDRTPKGGQRMLFSATLDGDVDDLVQRYFDSPAIHSAEPPALAQATMKHLFFRVADTDKNSIALRIASRTGRTMIFLRTKHAADRFTASLREVGVSALALHGDKSQANRTRTLAAFADGSVTVLVATDVAARGLHVDGITLVVHVDPPADAKDYTHRAGRTARAGETGTVVTLVTDSQQSHVAALAAEAGILAEFTDVTASSPALAESTGAQAPPGSPVVEVIPTVRQSGPAREVDRRRRPVPRRTRDKPGRSGRR